MESGQQSEVQLDAAPARRRSLRRVLYSQNPFYLLSVCFVLHGTGIWYRANAGTHSPWILTAIIAAYILMMAGVGFCIVRWGRVWDDARSILLILLALFLELGMTADDVLIGDRATGRAMALVAWLVSATVSEFILVGLRIRLGALYRIPFHLLLATILLYPIAIVRGDYPHNVEQNNLAIFLFSPIVTAILVALVPAVRRGASYVKDNGTPWMWPLFPWSLFVFLATIALFRSYALCLSFDPVLDISWVAALQLHNSFGGIYFAPILLAVAILCLEGFLSTGSDGVRRVGLLLPFLATVCASPGIWTSPLYLQVVEQIAGRVGPPVWLTVLGSSVLLMYAVCRRIRSSEIALSTSLVLLAFTGSGDSGLRSFDDPSQLPLILAAVIQVWTGWGQQASVKVFAGLLCCGVLIRSLLPTDDTFLLVVATWYLSLAVVLLVGLGMDDSFAKVLRNSAGLMLMATCLAAPVLPWFGLPQLDTLEAALHMIGATALSWLLSWRTQKSPFRAVAIVNTGVTSAGAALRLVKILLRIPGGKGILWALGGILWLALAAGISARKAGAPSPSIGRRRRSTTPPESHD